MVLVFQTLCLIGFLATVFPPFLDRITSPPVDCPVDTGCFDPTGTAFVIYFLIFVPVGGVLLTVAGLWRTDARWPAIVPIAIDLLLIGGALSNVNAPPDPLNAPIAADVLLLLVSALASLAVVVTFVAFTTWRLRKQPVAAIPGARNITS